MSDGVARFEGLCGVYPPTRCAPGAAIALLRPHEIRLLPGPGPARVESVACGRADGARCGWRWPGRITEGCCRKAWRCRLWGRATASICRARGFTARRDCCLVRADPPGAAILLLDLVEEHPQRFVPISVGADGMQAGLAVRRQMQGARGRTLSASIAQIGVPSITCGFIPEHIPCAQQHGTCPGAWIKHIFPGLVTPYGRKIRQRQRKFTHIARSRCCRIDGMTVGCACSVCSRPKEGGGLQSDRAAAFGGKSGDLSCGLGPQ